ncbi:predicted protein [Histoplasma capsulatum var. duboisii H88]|uniref:Predicted protein n=1 Tax=Ajellomyces capsulatus (strain H88) TaxID=544711 RepID=F0UAZ1_AJEC8|nr:predicted protein [Histoplasma capsulatum var. duboisii H88]
MKARPLRLLLRLPQLFFSNYACAPSTHLELPEQAEVGSLQDYQLPTTIPAPHSPGPNKPPPPSGPSQNFEERQLESRHACSRSQTKKTPYSSARCMAKPVSPTPQKRRTIRKRNETSMSNWELAPVAAA